MKFSTTSKSLSWFASMTTVFVTSALASPPAISTMSVSGNKLDLTITSDIGTTNQIQIATNLFHPAWADLATVVVTQSPYSFSANLSPAALQRFYRVVAIAPPSKVGVPSTMVLIPAGSFQMGDTFNEGAQWELPVHTVTISAFYLEKYEVSKGLWD